MTMANTEEQSAESAVAESAAQPVRDYHGEVWGYSSTKNPDVWDGACLTRQEAIDEGRANYDNNDPFWVVQGHWLEVADFFEADDVIECAETQVYDLAHEGAELDIREGGREALNALLTEWAEKYAELRSWRADFDAEEIAPQTVTQE
jgi:hypothetical protein